MTHPLAQDLTPLFELGALLGRGAFGAVHRARDREGGREVALKLLLADHRAVTLERFVREATVTATLDHPGIVRVHAVGRFQGSPCIVYELVDGQTLDEALRALDLPRRVALVRDAALAVGHAHASGVLHRDLKPANILVDRDGRVRVTDFGLAFFEGADRLTRTGAMLGTPSYMAPELFMLAKSASPAADVWALGVVLYEALTGRLPFDAVSLTSLVVQVDKGLFDTPRSIDPRISRALEAVCLRALASDPARRHPDATAFARDLDAALARPESGSRAPLVLALALALVLVLVLGLASSARPAVPLEGPSPPTSSTVTAAAPAPSAPARVEVIAARSGARWALFTDAEHLVTGGEQVPLCVWEVASGALVRTFGLRVVGGTRGPDRTFFGTFPDGRVRRVDLATGVTAETGILAARVARAAAKATILAVIEGDGQFATTLDTASGVPRVWLPAFSPDWRSVAISPDGFTLALIEQVGAAGSVHVFDAGADVIKLATHQVTTVDCALCFVDDSTLVVGETSGPLQVFGARGTQALPGFSGAARPRPSSRVLLATSSDGRRLVSATQDGDQVNLGVFDVATRQQLTDQAHAVSGVALALDVAPDGDSVALTVEGAGVHVRPLR